MIPNHIYNILHVDDDNNQLKFTKLFLEQDKKLNVTSIGSPVKALETIPNSNYECILTDYKMPEMDGITLAKKALEISDIPIIIYTGHGSEEVAQAAFAAGISDYFRKEMDPSHYQVLEKRIQHIVEQARAEKSLKVSEEKFRRFFMNQPVLCYMVSREGNIIEVNETVLDSLGYTREDLIGKPMITTLYSPSSRGKAEQLFRRWLETGIIRNEELNIVSKTGEERTVLQNVDAVRDESGGVVQSISIQVDITQRKQMEDETRIHHEESERYALILENMSDSVIVTDLDGVISYWNDGAKNIFGYSSEEMIGKSVKLLNLVEERGAVADSQLDAVRRGESYPTEWRGVKKNGSELWLLLHTKLLKDHEGNPAGMIGVGKEITQRRQAEEELRESEERYRTLVENSPNAISVTIGNTIVYANQKRADLAGKNDPSELFVTSALSQVAEGDRESIIEMMEARERGERPQSPFEYRMLRADGSVRDIVDYHSEISYQGTYAVQHVLQDVTDQKRYEKRLEALHRHATELGKAGTMDDVAERTLDAVKSVLGFNQSGFGVVEGSILHFVHLIGVSVDEGFELPLDGRGVTVRAARTGKTQLVADIRKDEDYVIGPAGRELGSLSELAVPVKIGEKVVAVINVESEKLDAFSESDRKLLEIFAEHVASAITRIDQLKKIESTESTYRKLIENSLDPMLVISGLEIVFLNKQTVRLGGYDDESDLLGKDFTIFIPEEDRKSIVERVSIRQQGKPQPNNYTIRFLRKDGEIRVVEVSVSLINYESRSSALIIARDVTQRIRDENRVMALHSHAASLAQAKTLEDVRKATLDAVESVIGFHLLSFLKVEKEGLISVGSRGAPPLKQRIPLDGKGITAKAAREKRSVLVKDTRGDPDFLRGTTDSLSELAAPVVVDGETVAVINMENLQPNAFDERDQRLVETLAMHVASAYQRIGESERQLDTVSRLSRTVRHDLMSPLQVIKNAIYLQRHSPGTVEDMVKTIDDSVDYAVKILDDLRTITTHRELVKSQVDLAELAKQSLDNNIIPASIRVERAFTGPVNINIHSTSIHRCLDNLIKNAVEAMPQGGTLTISLNVEEKSVKLAVKDTGEGISGETMKSLFKPLYSTKSSGRGLGLAFCKSVVEAHGGQITVESSTGEGATFTVMLLS